MDKCIPTNKNDCSNNNTDASFELEVLKNIISLMPGHVYWKDLNGVILGCNDSQAVSAGFTSSKDMIGKTDYDMPWREQADEVRKIDQMVVQTGEVVTTEERSVLSNGNESIFLSKKVPIRDKSGAIVGVAGISFDITDRKRAEEALLLAKNEAELANKSKSKFLSILNFKVREPLNQLSSILYLLKNRTHPTDSQLGYISAGERALNDFAPILERLHYFLGLNSGKVKGRRKEGNVKQIIEYAVKKATANQVIDNLNIIINFNTNLPNFITLDNYHLTQALEYLIGNAIRHTQHGEILIRVESLTIKSQDILHISIEDTGEGIEENRLNRIKELFSSKDDQSDLYIEQGLRLSITKKLVDLIGGCITIDSELNKYTKVDINVPYDQPNMGYIDNSMDDWIAYRREREVCIIDENLNSSNMISNSLLLPHSCIVNSKTALFRLQDIINSKRKNYIYFINISSSLTDPITFTRAIRESNNPEDIIIVYGNFKSEQLKLINRHDVNAYAIKFPIYPTELPQLVLNLCRKSSTVEPKILVIEDDPISLEFVTAFLEEKECSFDVATTGKDAINKVMNANQRRSTWSEASATTPA